jgi:hypothetical protein
MPRYIVERSFPEGLKIPVTEEGAEMCRKAVLNNEEDRVTWLHSYVSKDGTKTFCAYDAPSPEAIRRTPNGTTCRLIALPRSACSTHISIVNTRAACF